MHIKTKGQTEFTKNSIIKWTWQLINCIQSKFYFFKLINCLVLIYISELVYEKGIAVAFLDLTDLNLLIKLLSAVMILLINFFCLMIRLFS